jgi:hypothetical protein
MGRPSAQIKPLSPCPIQRISNLICPWWAIMSRNNYFQWNSYLWKSYPEKENFKFLKHNSAVNITVLFWYMFHNILYSYYRNSHKVHVSCSDWACR